MSKEEYEAKKKEKEIARQQEGTKMKGGESMKKIVRWIIWIVIIGLVFWWISGAVKKAGPQGEDFSYAVEIMNRDHIDTGSEHGEYNSNPPSSGWHYGSTARTGFSEEPIPDENIIHNLEHGDTWIAYHPRISEEVKSVLDKKFDSRFVVIAPRDANEFDISLSAWGRIDGFNIAGETLSELELQRISDFIKRYDNKGPERVRSAGAVGA